MNGQLFIHYSFAYNFVKANLHSNVAAKSHSESFVSIVGAKPRSVAFRLYCGDASLQNFFTAVSLNTIGSLENINELLSNNNYATAYFENNLIYSLRLQDQNNAIVNEICARLNMDFDNLSENDILILESIAYQYPSIGGEGVYRARAILGIDLDDTSISYRQSFNHLLSNSNKLLILPNPNIGRFKVVCSGGFAKGSEISVLDQAGRSIVKFSVDYEGSVFDGDLSHIQPGIYYIKAVTSNNIVLTQKLIIVK